MTKTFVGPAILITLGIVFLLNNFEILPWDIWLSLWKFWPVVLILVGVEILLGKNASVKTFIILGGLIFLVPIFLSYNPFTNNPLNTDKVEIEESLGTSTKARINFDFPTSNLKISALDTDSAFLAEGKIEYSEAAKEPKIERLDESGQTTLNLSQAFEGKLPFISNLKTGLDISLSQKVPLEIFIKTGASSINVDLANLRTEYLEINSGASNISIKLTEDFGQKIFIKTGASTISIEIPDNLAAKIIIDSQVKSVTVADRFKKEDNFYQTDNYSKAENKADIEIKAVAGSVEIK